AGGSAAAQQRLEGALARGGPWWFLALFVGGLLLNLTPCVFPMLGVTVSIFGARRREPLPRVLAHATLYVLGLCVMYSALGVAAALTGGLFGALLQNAWVNVGLGALLIGLSLGMFGVFEMQPPAWVLNRLGGANATSALGLFVSGLGVGIIAAPCVGPFVVAVLALVARRGSAPFGLATMFTLSFGLGFPYLFLATFSNLLQRLPRSGGWMEWVKKVFGVVMSAIGLDYVLLGLAPRLSPWVLPAALLLGGLYLGFLEKSANERRGFVGLKRGAGLAAVAGGVALVLFMQGAAARALTFRPYDAGAVAASFAAGRPVMLDFSADWCVPCHELELETFADPRVVAAARGFDAYRVDLTRYDSAESGRWRAQYAVAGVPTVVFLRPGGDEARAARVEGFVPADAFLARLKRVAP
ncbi:MAG TPA: cytochrome c biogenesis protein CcdA, partial [Candidatus Eisenbacteria bacterium]|nr:cytochrome c biogenesis protein CcdA [Candidatus Eisenbacteria bacterium]